MAGVIDIAMLLVILGGAYYVLKSGLLNSITAPAPAPIAVAPVTGDGTTPVVPADGTTPTTTTPPATTGNPLLDALNGLLGGGTGGTNTIPPVSNVPPQGVPIPQQPIYQGNPAECSSRYNGKCDTECKSGNSSLCNACQLACGGAAVGAVNVLPSQGSSNPSLCKSKYNGKCDSECQGGNSSTCQACKSACGSFGAYAYYVKTPQSLMTTTVFRDDHHSYYSSWGNIGVQNAR